MRYADCHRSFVASACVDTPTRSRKGHGEQVEYLGGTWPQPLDGAARDGRRVLGKGQGT